MQENFTVYKQAQHFLMKLYSLDTIRWSLALEFGCATAVFWLVVLSVWRKLWAVPDLVQYGYVISTHWNLVLGPIKVDSWTYYFTV